MCGRFTLFEPDAVLTREFGLSRIQAGPPRYNIAPSQPVAVVRVSPADRERELLRLRWGLIPSWAKDPSIGNRMINARAETASEKPSFRSAFRNRRCLVPADGFFEWRKVDRGKLPFYIRMRSGHPFAFAGLWERWDPPEGDPVETCTILTTEANELLRPIHDRMPVIVAPEMYGAWLDSGRKDPETLKPILRPWPPEEMDAYPVSKRVNDPSHDDPDCLTAEEAR
ncbi:MAG: SOS response-associated peptidase [Deltaproteobacteria bacterium]